MVEQIIAAARWPCKYGCTETYAGSQMVEHFAKCPARPVPCPACEEAVPPASMAAHYLAKKHPLRCATASSTHWNIICSNWEVDDHDRHSWIGMTFRLPDVEDEVLRALIRFSADSSGLAMVELFHCVAERACKVTFGSVPGRRMHVEMVSRPMQEYQSRQDLFEDEDQGDGFAFSVRSAESLAVDGRVGFTLKVFR